jgi:signal transduction histidine kinase
LAQIRYTSQVFPGSNAGESRDQYMADRRRLSESKPKSLAKTGALGLAIRRINSKTEKQAASVLAWKSALLVVICCILFSGCRARQASAEPFIEFSRVPLADEGGPGSKLATIEGRVIGAHPEHQIVLFARSGAWYVQPFADQPFTEIQQDSKWRNSIRLGTEYAALLVEPGYNPPSSMDVLPGIGGAVVAVAITKGEPAFWQTWWFRLSGGLACVFTLWAFYRLRLHQLSRQLNIRFEERLAERMRIAQELHDSLLQGFISASMQLHVAVDRLPADSQAKPMLGHVLQLNTARSLFLTLLVHRNSDCFAAHV